MNTFRIPNKWLNKTINIALIGCGGSGSACLTELFQLSFLLNAVSDGQMNFNVTAFDDDKVSYSNIGRQAFYIQDLGECKSTVLIERLNVFGGVNWTAKEEYFKPSKHLVCNNDKDQYDLIITCVDTAKVRVELGEYGRNNNSDILWLDMGNSDFEAQMVLGHLGSADIENHLPNVYDLYPSLKDIEDIKEDSCSHVEALNKQSYSINKKVVLEATGILWLLLREGVIKRHGSFINLKEGTVMPLDICPTSWSLLGYQKPNNNKLKKE